jgi:hypothetical protein
VKLACPQACPPAGLTVRNNSIPTLPIIIKKYKGDVREFVHRDTTMKNVNKMHYID